MGFKVFIDGEVLEAAEVNDYLMEQAVIACTSATRPSSPNEGMVIYETDTDKVLIYTGAAWMQAVGIGGGGWTDYSGSLAWTGSGGNPSIGNGTIAARYTRSGNIVIYKGSITMGSTTSFGSGTWSVSLPINAQSVYDCGAAVLFDNSTVANRTSGTVRIDTATTAIFYSIGGAVTPAVPFTWADGDVLRWAITYEAA